MKQSIRLALLCALGAIGAAPAVSSLTAAVSPPAAAPAPPASTTSICHATASAARQAARRDAQDEYWIAVAKCLNGPHSGACQHDAAEAREEALELAEEQYHARLDACGLLGQGAYDPEIDPDDFSSTVDNPYNPLVPGRTLVYESNSPDGEHNEVTALSETVDINGVRCRKVHDVVTVKGAVVEDTLDFFAQRSNGDVWYFGEVSQSFEDGFLDNLDGSWRFGKDDAKPGIIMLANAQVDDVYRQEFLVAEAEDIAKILATNETVTVPAGTFQHCLKTLEWSPLEPDAIEHKFYAPGIGVILEVTPSTGERIELVQIIN
jgi:hypothetical protein